MNFQETLLSFIENKSKCIADKDYHVTKSLFMDWFACMLTGMKSTSYRKFKNVVLTKQQFSGISMTDLNNSELMGFASHCLELDDSEFFCETHPSSVIFSSLMDKENNHFSIEEIFKSAIIAFYCAIPLGRMANPRHYSTGWHGTGTMGSFLATISNCFLHTFSRTEIKMALSVCATKASGIQNVFGTDAKYINSSTAAKNGVFSRRFISNNLTSSEKLFDEDSHFFKIFNTEKNTCTNKTFNGIRNLSFIKVKKYPFCHCLVPLIDSILSLDFDLNELKKLRIDVYFSKYSYSLLSTELPSNTKEAFFSIPYAIEEAIRYKQGASPYLISKKIKPKLGIKIKVHVKDSLEFFNHSLQLSLDKNILHNKTFVINREFGPNDISFIDSKFKELLQSYYSEQLTNELFSTIDNLDPKSSLLNFKNNIVNTISSEDTLK